MRYYVMTGIQAGWPGTAEFDAVRTSDDMIVHDKCVSVRVSARQFERIVTTLRAGMIRHRIETGVAPPPVRPEGGIQVQRTQEELQAAVYTVLLASEPPIDDEPF